MDPISSSYGTKGRGEKKLRTGLPICPPGPPGERLDEAPACSLLSTRSLLRSAWQTGLSKPRHFLLIKVFTRFSPPSCHTLLIWGPHVSWQRLAVHTSSYEECRTLMPARLASLLAGPVGTRGPGRRHTARPRAFLCRLQTRGKAEGTQSGDLILEFEENSTECINLGPTDKIMAFTHNTVSECFLFR